ncbi:MAG: hypothetical protein JNL82_29810 [Myxococcales bacterium]|nr:hypothetical protein [Myxococcales bacterium]
MGLSKSQAVTAARLIKAATKSGALPKELPHAGTILVGEARVKPPARHSRAGLTTAFVAGSDWSYDLDAGLLVDALRTALLVLFRQGILEGQKPDGTGAQPRLTERVANRPGRKGKTRGYNTGYFADNLRASKITGSTTAAQSRILPPTNRNVYIANEAKRGISFFTVQGTAAQVIAEVTDKFIEGGIVNRNRAADLAARG